MRTTKRGKAAALAVGIAALAGSAAVAGSAVPVGATATTAPAGTTAATTAAPTGTLPASTGTDQATYAQEEEGVNYNNSTGSANSFANTVVLNMLAPFAFGIDGNLNFYMWKDLLESADVVSTDPQVIEYKVNPKAVWSDGVAIDCKDWYYSWMANAGKVEVANPEYAAGKKDANGNDIPEKLPLFDSASTTGYEDIKSITCATPQDIKVEFSTPYADWKGLFGALLPAHVAEQKAGVADITKVDVTAESAELTKLADMFNKGWQGWDPSVALSGAWYKIANYTPDQGIVLVRNEKFWGEPAKIATLTLKTVTDATAQATALQNNELQAIQPQADPGVADQLRGASGVTFAPNAGLTFEHLDLNMKNPLFQDAAVRKAFGECVDRQDIIDKLVAPINPDTPLLNSVIFMPGQNGYKDDFTLKFDTAAAKADLEAAGWKLGSNGVYEKDGKKLAFRISHKGIQRRSDTTQNIIASCKEAGFAITEDSDTKFNAERLPVGDFDVALFAWVGNPLLSSATSIYSKDGGANYQAYADDKIAPLYEQANKELDEAKRLALMQEIDKQIMDDMVTIPLFQLAEMPAWRAELTGPIFNGPLGLTWNANVWNYL